MTGAAVGEVMSSSGTRGGGRFIFVTMALAIAAFATHQLAAAPPLDESLDAVTGDGGITDQPLEALTAGDEMDDERLLDARADEPAPAGPFANPGSAWKDGAVTEPSPADAGRHQLPPDGPRPEPRPTGEVGRERPSTSPGGTRSEEAALRLIYFVETDREFDSAAVAAIERQAVALQRYWYEQFGGTFRLPAGGVDVVYGDHPAGWYDQTSAGGDERWNRLSNIRDEVRRKLDLPDDPGAVRTLTYPDARIDGRVGANRYEGAWMDGDDISCVTGIVETTPYTLDYPASCLATVAHELGHVYGLGHEGTDEDCMQFGFYRYVSGDRLCDFGPENRALVVADPRNAAWLDAAPGDRG